MAAHAMACARDLGGLAGVGEIELLVVPDEELGSVASRPWIEERARRGRAPAWDWRPAGRAGGSTSSAARSVR